MASTLNDPQTLPDHALPAAAEPVRTAQRPYLSLGPTTGWSAFNLREIWRYRELLLTLAGRDLKLRYKQTVLGVAWVVLQPILAAMIFAFVFGRIAGLSSSGVAYFPFAFAGLLAWNLFSNTLSRSSICMVANAALVSKVYFPRLIMPLSTALSALVDFAVSLIILVIVFATYSIDVSSAAWTAPLWLGCVLLLSLGLGFAASALTVSYRDIQHITPVALQMLLYASPIAYAVAEVPERVRGLYMLNPMAPLLEAFRWSVFASVERPPTGSLVYAVVLSLAMFAAGAVIFKIREKKFADVI